MASIFFRTTPFPFGEVFFIIHFFAYMLRTAESVSIGHPDKVCDQISDAVLDAFLAQDSQTRAAIEVLGGHGIITVCGELTTNASVNIRKIAE